MWNLVEINWKQSVMGNVYIPLSDSEMLPLLCFANRVTTIQILIKHNIILYSLVLECAIKNLIIINLQSMDDWQLLNHNKQWTTIISTIKDNWTQQLWQSHNGNNTINIIQHAFPFLFCSMSHATNIKVIYILMEF